MHRAGAEQGRIRWFRAIPCLHRAGGNLNAEYGRNTSTTYEYGAVGASPRSPRKRPYLSATHLPPWGMEVSPRAAPTSRTARGESGFSLGSDGGINPLPPVPPFMEGRGGLGMNNSHGASRGPMEASSGTTESPAPEQALALPACTNRPPIYGGQGLQDRGRNGRLFRGPRG